MFLDNSEKLLKKLSPRLAASHRTHFCARLLKAFNRLGERVLFGIRTTKAGFSESGWLDYSLGLLEQGEFISHGVWTNSRRSAPPERKEPREKGKDPLMGAVLRPSRPAKCTTIPGKKCSVDRQRPADIRKTAVATKTRVRLHHRKRQKREAGLCRAHFRSRHSSLIKNDVRLLERDVSSSGLS